eukprot:NODE_4750_length_746_cov_18.294023_g4589_i0.p3 GENE.NODE_4750_length_746_cov_18.294023_g4589_i0~~NODE_4750_length_746_cov_18.294023_g4589_i0.p3  ORF type:complete len:182 (-),score=29.00 NODE_4750_length_746_cov_18.294023_g4589_i0:98-643(-)
MYPHTDTTTDTRPSFHVEEAKPSNHKWKGLLCAACCCCVSVVPLLLVVCMPLAKRSSLVPARCYLNGYTVCSERQECFHHRLTGAECRLSACRYDVQWAVEVEEPLARPNHYPATAFPFDRGADTPGQMFVFHLTEVLALQDCEQPPPHPSCSWTHSSSGSPPAPWWPSPCVWWGSGAVWR